MTTQKLTLNFPLNIAFPLPKIVSFPFFLVLISLVLALSFTYLFQVEKLTKASYLLKAYQQEIKTTAEQNLILQEQSSRLFSLVNLEEEIEKLNFVESSEIKYIPITFDYLARRSN